MFKEYQHAEQVFKWIKTGTIIIVAIYMFICCRMIRQIYQPSPMKNLAVPSLVIRALPGSM